MGLKGVFGGLSQAIVLVFEDQNEGPGVMRDEEEDNYCTEREERGGMVIRLCCFSLTCLFVV